MRVSNESASRADVAVPACTPFRDASSPRPAPQGERACVSLRCSHPTDLCSSCRRPVCVVDLDRDPDRRCGACEIAWLRSTRPMRIATESAEARGAWGVVELLGSTRELST